MTYGPIDLIALEFPGNRFRGEILPELFDLVEKKIIPAIPAAPRGMKLQYDATAGKVKVVAE